MPAGTLAVVFTSGSTGRPRGIVLPVAAMLASAAASAAHLGWRDDDRALACLPLAHVGGLSVILRGLIARRPVVLHEGSFDAPAVARLMADHQVTLASLVPTQLAALLEDPGWRPPDDIEQMITLLEAGAYSPYYQRTEHFYNGALLLLDEEERERERERYRRLFKTARVSWINNHGTPEQTVDQFLAAVGR